MTSKVLCLEVPVCDSASWRGSHQCLQRHGPYDDSGMSEKAGEVVFLYIQEGGGRDVRRKRRKRKW